MSKWRDRAKRYNQGIREVLMEEWDPIGVKGIPEAEDEYDLEVSVLYKILISDEPEYKIFRVLDDFEKDVGLNSSYEKKVTVVQSLLRLKADIEGVGVGFDEHSLPPQSIRERYFSAKKSLLSFFQRPMKSKSRK